MQVEVVAYDDSWQEYFSKEAGRLTDFLGPAIRAIHHIGSISVPGMFAKPIIDILLEVDSLSQLDAKIPQIMSLGYEALGEFGIAGRRYFRRSNLAGVRTHQIHAFESDSAECQRHLAFRDYLIAHSEVAAEYSELKRSLAREFPADIDAYMGGKDSFIKIHESKALAIRK